MAKKGITAYSTYRDVNPDQVLKTRQITRPDYHAMLPDQLLRPEYPEPQTIETFKDRFELYYKDCMQREVPLTIAGLHAWEGVHPENESAWFRKFPELGEVFIRIKAFIRQDIEERLTAGDGNTAGLIFLLKNHYGYTDRRELAIMGHVSVGELIDNIAKEEVEEGEVVPEKEELLIENLTDLTKEG